MRILTKNQEEREKAERDELSVRKMQFLARRVYEKTLEWNGVNMMEPIPDKGRELDRMVEDIFLVDEVIL